MPYITIRIVTFFLSICQPFSLTNKPKDVTQLGVDEELMCRRRHIQKILVLPWGEHNEVPPVRCDGRDYLKRLVRTKMF